MKKILFIDNSKPVRLLLHNFFKKEYNVVTLPDSAAALHYVSAVEMPDLIIIDPAESRASNDYTFIRYIKKSAIFRDIQIIVLTKDVANIEELLSGSEVSLCVQKPFDPIKLRGTIQTVLAS